MDRRESPVIAQGQYVIAKRDGHKYLLGQLYVLPTGEHVMFDKYGDRLTIGPSVSQVVSVDRPRKRTYGDSESKDCDEDLITPVARSLSRDLFVATTHRLGQIAKSLAGTPYGEEAQQMHDILASIDHRMFDTVGRPLKEATAVVVTGTQTSRPTSPLASTATTSVGVNDKVADDDKTSDRALPEGCCPSCQKPIGGDSTMDVDTPVESKKKSKRNRKKKPSVVAPLAPTAPEQPSHSTTDTNSKDATWTEVVGRKAKRLGGAEAAATNSPDFPALPSPKVVPRRLPPLRSAVLIVRVSPGSSYEETVAVRG